MITIIFLYHCDFILFFSNFECGTTAFEQSVRDLRRVTYSILIEIHIRVQREEKLIYIEVVCFTLGNEMCICE